MPKPEPKAGEVLVSIHATTVSRTDCGMLRPHPLFVRFVAGLLRPKLTILGMDFAGIVEAVGAGVNAFKPGNRVFGLSPNIYVAHAEYLRVVDYTAEDSTQIEETFDFVFDAVGKTSTAALTSMVALTGVRVRG